MQGKVATSIFDQNNSKMIRSKDTYKLHPEGVPNIDITYSCYTIAPVCQSSCNDLENNYDMDILSTLVNNVTKSFIQPLH